MSQPQSYIIVENDDGTFTAYVNFGNYISKEEAERKRIYKKLQTA